MNFYDLSFDQKCQLKQHLYCQKFENQGVSWEDLADIDNLVSNEEIEAEYGNTEFSEDDFF